MGLVFGSGVKVIGADISPESVKNCREQLSSEVKNVEFVQVDFFADNEELGGFDFIFDHTFFCAIEPSLRLDWASRMDKLLGAKMGSYLLTIIYPLPASNEADLSVGPPFEVTFSAYEDVLKVFGFECLKRWNNSELPASNQKRLGREELAIWRKK